MLSCIINKKNLIKLSVVSLITIVVALTLATRQAIQGFPADLAEHIQIVSKNTYLDRAGQQLNITYENAWNMYDVVQLHEVPEFLKEAVITSEDKRFFKHSGVDWLARINALKQNIQARSTVRGASTITEQVVRMLHPRPRTLWSRWIEGFEAYLLENSFTKLEILEFYLNQVPYGARRRGVVQAAHYYFDRDLSTLNKKEMLTLTVLVRSPKWLDPRYHTNNLEKALANLVQRITVSDRDRQTIQKQKMVVALPQVKPDMSHFINFAENMGNFMNVNQDYIHTTIDLELQQKIQNLLDNRLNQLNKRNVLNGAVLAVDHESNEIISWAVGYAGNQDKQYNQINAVTVKRQPGSTLKPLLYANAMVKGWTAATMLDDSPLEESVGLGMHTYHNYSRDHYGLISLRESLGNSLNIPAVKALQFIGPVNYLAFLKDLGFDSLSGHPNVYGDGLALGNGEVSLYELVQAYTAIARMGDFKPLYFIQGEANLNDSYRVLSDDIASMIADIMSDPIAREKEFGLGSILNFPYQTAVKTGTSSDYRDAWAIGFNDKYTVGIWFGNLNYSEMNEVTGSSGPSVVLRAVFNELNKHRDVKPLYFSKNLFKKTICVETGLIANDQCDSRDEWFIAGTEPTGEARQDDVLRIRKPGNGLNLAMDPRIPDEQEYFEFAISQTSDIEKVDWFINEKLIARTDGAVFHWKLAKGQFTTYASVYRKGLEEPVKTETVEYIVH